MVSSDSSLATELTQLRAAPEPHPAETELARTVARDLDILGIPAASWVEPLSDAPPGVYDVVIVGGGQSGLGAAFGLLREGVRNLLILDENPAGQEGPWITYARMLTLRTPKHLTGIDLGIPSLTYRAWHEARYGKDHWDMLDKISREDWMAYLRWYRRVLDLPVWNEVRVVKVAPHGEGVFALSVTGPNAPATPLLARKVIFATGIQGGGEWHVPEHVRRALPAERYSHSSQPIDFGRLRGKRIGILGGGASAFDNAYYALTHGCAEAHVFVRRNDLPRVNPIRHWERSGISRHFPLLSDAHKYAAMAHFLAHPQPPTNDTFARASAQPGFRLHLGAPWQSVRFDNDAVLVRTSSGELDFDFVIVSTGMRNDVALRPELAEFVDHIALWRDRYHPAKDRREPLVDQHPYLGPSFELTGRTPAARRLLHGLFVFNYSALVSLGLSAASLSGLRFAIPRLVAGVAGQLFLDDQDSILARYLAYAEPEFQGQWPAG